MWKMFRFSPILIRPPEKARRRRSSHALPSADLADMMVMTKALRGLTYAKNNRSGIPGSFVGSRLSGCCCRQVRDQLPRMRGSMQAGSCLCKREERRSIRCRAEGHRRLRPNLPAGRRPEETWIPTFVASQRALRRRLPEVHGSLQGCQRQKTGRLHRQL